jgi:hypothetical protein
MNETIEPMDKEQERCGAKTRSGKPCRKYPVKGKRRCQNHGGKSTGPTTPEGLERSRRGNWKHGRRSAEAIAHRKARAKFCRLTDPGKDSYNWNDILEAFCEAYVTAGFDYPF